MAQLPQSPRPTTAIPPRFRQERERVLRILARWEESTRSAAAGTWRRGAAAEQPCGC